jgi:pyruvate kinase
LSFVRDATDILVLKKELKKNKIKSQIVAKIETEQAINNLDSIINQADAVMVARGDLGVEMSLEQVPYYQKLIIQKCLLKRKAVITATQMLQSMIANPFPTRAEVSDIANAVYDYTDAIMLSGETATGKFPDEAVQIMAKSASFIENNRSISDIRRLFQFSSQDSEATIVDTAYNLYYQGIINEQRIAAIITFTKTGRTARLLASYHFPIPIYALCPDKKTADSLSLYYGVTPFIQSHIYDKRTAVTAEQITTSLQTLLTQGLISSKDKVIVLHGDVWNVEGQTSTIKLLSI